jgi:hypothetical protein
MPRAVGLAARGIGALDGQHGEPVGRDHAGGTLRCGSVPVARCRTSATRVGGVVELPLRLDWSEQGRYDLCDERQRNLMYERVIRESMRVEDLRAFVHGPTLAKVWRQLWLPRKVRTLWESRFPSLPRAA